MKNVMVRIVIISLFECIKLMSMIDVLRKVLIMSGVLCDDDIDMLC